MSWAGVTSTVLASQVLGLFLVFAYIIRLILKGESLELFTDA